MSTFLLEMALDEARLRQRLAARLLDERRRRGGGDARRFPQPRMAELLDVTLRTYQDWEGGVRVPSWRNLEEVAALLEIPLAELVDDGDPAEPEVTPSEREQAAAIRQDLQDLRASMESLTRVVLEVLQDERPKRRASAS